MSAQGGQVNVGTPRAIALEVCGNDDAQAPLSSMKSRALSMAINLVNYRHEGMRCGYGHMVLDHCLARLRAVASERRARLAALETREQALNYQAQVRQAVAATFSDWPARTPLHARITGRADWQGMCVERVLFESRPGCLVTANLYLPHDLHVPAPAVLVCCGHSDQGKAYSLYQGCCQRLATAGFVALTFDPLNQGERDQYSLLERREEVADCVSAHLMMGKQLELLGESLYAWVIWDGIRALDYLLSRPEVDPTRVGVTGNSGGGTLSTWLWALDDRLTMAAPSCFVTTFVANMENELPADAEQYPPGALAAGLEMADFLIARAPQPLLLVGQSHDFFDRRGFQQACAEVARFYRLLGAAPEVCASFLDTGTHGFWPEAQRAIVSFFAAQAGIGPAPQLPETQDIPEIILRVTNSGQVVREGGMPLYELIAARSAELAAKRQPLALPGLRARAAELLQIDRIPETPHYRVLRPRQEGETTYARYAIETEGNVRAILHCKVSVPGDEFALDVADAAYLFLPHCSSEEDLRGDPLALSLQQQHELYALDVRGLGESTPDSDLSFWHPYGVDYMLHGMGTMLNQSYLGRRVWDVLAALQLLTSAGASELHLYGRGQGAILALFAALLHPHVASLTLKNYPRSWSGWTTCPLVAWPAANFPHGVLRSFDIDDCLQALPGKVTLIEPWDASMQPIRD